MRHSICTGTAQEEAQYIQKIQHPVRKLAHMTEYFLLAVSVSFPLYVYGVRGIWLLLLAGGFCVGFAALDEYHQSFVAGRGTVQAGRGHRQHRNRRRRDTGSDCVFHRQSDRVPAAGEKEKEETGIERARHWNISASLFRSVHESQLSHQLPFPHPSYETRASRNS